MDDASQTQHRNRQRRLRRRFDDERIEQEICALAYEWLLPAFELPRRGVDQRSAAAPLAAQPTGLLAQGASCHG